MKKEIQIMLLRPFGWSRVDHPKYGLHVFNPRRGYAQIHEAIMEEYGIFASKFTWMIIAALFFAFVFWLGRKSVEINRPEIPDSSVAIKDSIQSKLWKSAYDSIVPRYNYLWDYLKKNKVKSTTKIQQNEINKNEMVEFNDTIVYYFNDSLRAKYKERYISPEGDIFTTPNPRIEPFKLKQMPFPCRN